MQTQDKSKHWITPVYAPRIIYRKLQFTSKLTVNGDEFDPKCVGNRDDDTNMINTGDSGLVQFR